MEMIAFQKRNGVPVPFTEEDREKWDNYKENITCGNTLSVVKC